MSITKEYYEELSKAGKTLCEFCQSDNCSCCQITKLLDDAYVECPEVSETD